MTVPGGWRRHRCSVLRPHVDRAGQSRPSTSPCAPRVMSISPSHHRGRQSWAPRSGRALGDGKRASAGLAMPSSRGRNTGPRRRRLSGRPYCVHTGEPGHLQHHYCRQFSAPTTQIINRHVFESLAANARIAARPRVVRARPAISPKLNVQGRRAPRCQAVEPDPRIRRAPRPQRVCDSKIGCSP